jgi:hypothetical protein
MCVVSAVCEFGCAVVCETGSLVLQPCISLCVALRGGIWIFIGRIQCTAQARPAQAVQRRVYSFVFQGVLRT